MQYGKRSLYFPKNLFVIADIHNQGSKLKSLLSNILPLFTEEDHLVFSGDLINRGKESCISIFEITSELLLKYPNQIFFVTGNHESMITKWYFNGRKDYFKYFESTLNSIKDNYGLPNIEADTIKQWLKNNPNIYLNHLIPYYETSKVIVTHAPISKSMCFIHDLHNNPEGILDRMGDALLWEFIDEKEKIPEIEKFLICGHQYGHYRTPRVFKDRCFLDTGCGKNGTAPCTAIKFPGKKWWQSD